LEIQRGILQSVGYSLFDQTVTITNLGEQALQGPLGLIDQGLQSTDALVDASGTYQGNPYIALLAGSSPLAAGQSLTLQFLFPGKMLTLADIDYSLEVLQGI
jgi:uncharacterized protein